MPCFAALKPDKTGDYRTGLGCFSRCTQKAGGESFLKSCLQYHSQSLPAPLAHEFLVEGIRHAHVLVPSVLSVDGFRTGGIPVRLVQDWPSAGKIHRLGLHGNIQQLTDICASHRRHDRCDFRRRNALHCTFPILIYPHLRHTGSHGQLFRGDISAVHSSCASPVSSNCPSIRKATKSPGT